MARAVNSHVCTMAVAAHSISLCSLPAETSPLEYSVYKPCLVLFGLVDHFQGKLKVERSSTHTHTHTHTHTCYPGPPVGTVSY